MGNNLNKNDEAQIRALIDNRVKTTQVKDIVCYLVRLGKWKYQ